LVDQQGDEHGEGEGDAAEQQEQGHQDGQPAGHHATQPPDRMREDQRESHPAEHDGKDARDEPHGQSEQQDGADDERDLEAVGDPDGRRRSGSGLVVRRGMATWLGRTHLLPS
jgi:hypothetical protein